MLGTHSELRRGQMSHICDISPLRVKTLSSDYMLLAQNVSINGYVYIYILVGIVI